MRPGAKSSPHSARDVCEFSRLNALRGLELRERDRVYYGAVSRMGSQLGSTCYGETSVISLRNLTGRNIHKAMVGVDGKIPLVTSHLPEVRTWGVFESAGLKRVIWL